MLLIQNSSSNQIAFKDPTNIGSQVQVNKYLTGWTGGGGGAPTNNSPGPGGTTYTATMGDLSTLGPITFALLDFSGNVIDLVYGFVDAYNINTVYNLLTTALAAVPNNLLDQVNGVEVGVTPRQSLRAMASVLAGKSSPITGGVQYVGIGVATNRVAVQVPSAGSRSSVTLTL